MPDLPVLLQDRSPKPPSGLYVGHHRWGWPHSLDKQDKNAPDGPLRLFGQVLGEVLGAFNPVSLFREA